MMEKSFESLLRKAIAGDQDTVEEILKLYMPMIDNQSHVNGQFDEDCKQHIMMQVALQLSRFTI